MFTLSEDDLREVYRKWRASYSMYGYHSWEYWHTTQDAMAVFGELLEDAIRDSNSQAWDAIEVEMTALIVNLEDEAATE